MTYSTEAFLQGCHQEWSNPFPVSQYISQESVCDFPITSASGRCFLFISTCWAAIYLALLRSSLCFSSIFRQYFMSVCVCVLQMVPPKHIALSWVHSHPQPRWKTWDTPPQLLPGHRGWLFLLFISRLYTMLQLFVQSSYRSSCRHIWAAFELVSSGEAGSSR